MTTKISAAEYADVSELFKAGRGWERSLGADVALRRSGRIKPRKKFHEATAAIVEHQV